MSLVRYLLLLLVAFSVSAADHPSIPIQTAQVYFSPQGGCTDAIVAEISAAQASVRVQAYSFTSPPIAKALVAAKNRGVDVKVILDSSQESERYSSADFLTNSGISVQVDSIHAIAHNKVIVIDGRTVITGSFNFTSSAETKNAENLLVLRSAELSQLYLTNWADHASHSKAYVSKSQRAGP